MMVFSLLAPHFHWTQAPPSFALAAPSLQVLERPLWLV
jgi:hypothetical protein